MNASATVQLQIIVGSTREGRAADRFPPWLAERAKVHGSFEVGMADGAGARRRPFRGRATAGRLAPGAHVRSLASLRPR